MKREYKVITPIDFQSVISDVFHYAKENNLNPLIITLRGDLGAGKTTFTQELGAYLGINEKINSPTFVIMKQYDVSYDKFESLVHIDAYRIENQNEVKPLRFDELMNSLNSIVCIEWPEKIPDVIPKPTLKIEIKIEDDESRTVTLET